MTLVTFGGKTPEVEAPPVREPAPAGQPAPVESARPPRRWRGVVERLFPGFWAVPPEAPPQAGPDPAEPEPAEPEPPAPEASEGPEQIDEERARAVLDGALDSLGSAHHRPFSRG